ncbi:uncharacterized protein si:ch211-122l24.6 [Engraulis encrasicolus]|uniref:uncharacterized protein si:ch211-122l24.6 n=1 Tax=Engraulis encrasicolus TaxID=184585 RepID=UPI002FD723D0
MGLGISYPLVTEPESYVDADYDEESDAFDFGKQLHEITLSYCYELIEHRIRSIKETEKFKKYGYTWPDVVYEFKEKYPEWRTEDITNIKRQFEFFDTCGDRLLKFEDFCQALDLMNNEDSEEERKAIFDAAAIQGYNTLNFDEYIELLYKMKKGMPIVHPPEEDDHKDMEEIMNEVSQMDPFRQMCYGVF